MLRQEQVMMHRRVIDRARLSPLPSTANKHNHADQEHHTDDYQKGDTVPIKHSVTSNITYVVVSCESLTFQYCHEKGCGSAADSTEGWKPTSN